MRAKQDPLLRFMAKVHKLAGASACWRWTGAIRSTGYGSFHFGRASETVPAHRWSYEHFKGPIPAGLQIDHLCRNRWCVNPDHLEPVTCRENLLRGQGPTAQHARATHCPQGHPYDAANTVHRKNGTRACRACIAVWNAQQHAQNRDRLLAQMRDRWATRKAEYNARRRSKYATLVAISREVRAWHDQQCPGRTAP